MSAFRPTRTDGRRRRRLAPAFSLGLAAATLGGVGLLGTSATASATTASAAPGRARTVATARGDRATDRRAADRRAADRRAAERRAYAAAADERRLLSLTRYTVASTTAPNGDTNPYGLAIVPVTAGKLTAGNLLVVDFDDSRGVAGAGTSIVQVDPTTGATSLFFQGGPVAGPVGIAINPVNDGVWVGDYGAAADGSAANDVLISAAGVATATFTDASTGGAASFAGVWGQAVSDANGVVSFYWGNAGDGSTGSGGGDVWRLTPHPTGPHNGQPVNSTYAQLATGQLATPQGGDAATAAGPQGLAYDSADGDLYETNDASDTLFAIPDAATATGPTTPQVVAFGGWLQHPENVAVDPVNGNLFVVDGGRANDIVEITPQGRVVAVRDLAPGQAGGALFGMTATTDSFGRTVVYFVDDTTGTVDQLRFTGYHGRPARDRRPITPPAYLPDGARA